jgi:hypothetical protein
MGDVAAEFQRCRLLANPGERLACYDAVALPADKAKSGESAGNARTPAGGNATASQPPAATAAPEAAFGLESRAPASAPLPAIEGSIVGRFLGWTPRARIELASGQVWEISDGSEAAYDLRDPKVRISRGFSGSFFMQIDGVAQTPRVRRIR